MYELCMFVDSKSQWKATRLCFQCNKIQTYQDDHGNHDYQKIKQNENIFIARRLKKKQSVTQAQP